ncbi:3-oxoacyl-ACP synthase [Flavicella sediminum]|uniref:3-oxoacyl-ACP synthase n=1 Tax=Flavicella sediminum TaxID=2585141 RepID=UPI00111E7536|nr:3-oxoacyl-ACP synthase [Flavicella sediminum]
MSSKTLKEVLYRSCKDFVTQKLYTIESTIKSNQEDLNSETKSSAGDKHETGRAMLQLEMEKAGQQLKEVQQMKLLLERVNLEENTALVRLGSVVKTNVANYFMAISSGKISVEGEAYYAISPSSPIGRLLLGKKNKESFLFQGRNFVIESLL